MFQYAAYAGVCNHRWIALCACICYWPRNLEEARMKTLSSILLLFLLASPASAQEVSIGDTDIGGVVTGASGPEAGVWVIAETTDLPTKLAKIVVTDDRGRYLIPDLPKANYRVW